MGKYCFFFIILFVLESCGDGVTTCQCTTDSLMETRCQCGDIDPMPLGLTPSAHSLTVTNGALKTKNVLPIKPSIVDLSITKMPEFTYVENTVFQNMPNLKSVRIVHTALSALPVIRGLGNVKALHLVDFESNKIRIVRSNNALVRTNQLVLDYNIIERVEDWAFNGSEIGKLSFRGNRELVEISEFAFGGIKSLRDLDLSETSITTLPSYGLGELEVLRLAHTETLKTVPSIYDISKLRKALMTYSFHCCAFNFPEKHNPIRHREYLIQNKMCLDAPSRSERDMYDGFGDFEEPEEDTNRNISIHHLNGYDSDVFEEEGVFHRTSAAVPDSKLEAKCGNITKRKPVECWPQPDPLNPCEDMMSWVWLRASVWIVLSTAIVGNAAVLVVIISSRSEKSVARFLMCNLAFADLCMALYLLLLAIMDIVSTEAYFNYAYDWQRGIGCKVAGFLTVFSTQLSLFTLSLLTVERWFAIRHALSSNLLDLRLTSKIMIFGWGFAITMAALPLLGVSNYSRISICLPMDVHDKLSILYVVILLLTSGIAFVLMCVCYAQIYLSLSYETRNSRGEGSVAKKMLLLVATNFACWAPISFFALTALAGHPLINVTESKILLVFIYPINSCANPYLYAIMTKQYRKDLILLLSRFGLCKKCAQEYKLVYSRPSHDSPLTLTTGDTQL